jgi:hypothetical protein
MRLNLDRSAPRTASRMKYRAMRNEQVEPATEPIHPQEESLYRAKQHTSYCDEHNFR